MVDNAAQLIEARRLIGVLVRTCRQVLAYLNGISAMDQKRIKRTLQDSVNAGEQYLTRH